METSRRPENCPNDVVPPSLMTETAMQFAYISHPPSESPRPRRGCAAQARQRRFEIARPLTRVAVTYREAHIPFGLLPSEPESRLFFPCIIRWDRGGSSRTAPRSFGDLRFAQQLEVGLEARLVGQADPAQRPEAKLRCDADQLTHSLRRLVGTAKPGGSKCEDTIGKDEVAVAIDRLAGMRDGFSGGADRRQDSASANAA